MAHQLEMINDKAQMAYRKSGGLPWHGLGTPVSDDMTPHEMMVAAGLDWTVRKADNYISVKGKRIKTGRQTLVRENDGQILTHVGKGWNPVQNADAFDFFNEFVSSGDMQMDTAGSLRDGMLVWAMADVNESFSIFGGDEVKGYLLFSNPHEYGHAIDVKFVMERVVCNNTLAVALREDNQPAVRMNHCSTFDPSKVKELLGIGSGHIQKFKQAAEYLGSKRYNEESFTRFLGQVFGVPSKEGQLLSRNGKRALEIVETQPGSEFKKGSWWQAFNAVTYLTDHELGKTADARMASSLFGNNAKKKVSALNLAVEMAENA